MGQRHRDNQKRSSSGSGSGSGSGCGSGGARGCVYAKDSRISHFNGPGHKSKGYESVDGGAKGGAGEVGFASPPVDTGDVAGVGGGVGEGGGVTGGEEREALSRMGKKGGEERGEREGGVEEREKGRGGGPVIIDGGRD